MSRKDEPYSPSGSASILWLVAVTQDPTTAKDAAEFADCVDSRARLVLNRLEESGFVVQEPVLREMDTGHERTVKGYQIAIPEPNQ